MSPPVQIVELAKAKETLKALRDEQGFDMLVDVTAVDYLKLDGHPERFAVVWNLLSTKANKRQIVKAYLDEEDPRAPTVSDLWPAADWGEREVFDMFGIRFDGHPGLRRILMPEDYGSHPLLKEYPLRGRGERDNFPVLRRGQQEAQA
jgi:NADH-quinone oxidoreductase subunit C